MGRFSATHGRYLVMFEIPKDLSLFSAQGLETLRAQARTEYNTLLASVDQDTVTDEQLDRLEALKAFDSAATSQISAFSAAADTSRADRLSALTPAEDAAPEEGQTEDTQSSVEEPAAALSISQVAANNAAGTALEGVIVDEEEVRYGSLVAAADVPGFAASQELTMRQVAEAFINRTRGYRALGNGKAEHGVATLVRDYPAEFSVQGTEQDEEVFNAVINESRLPGGSLLKSAELRRAEIARQDPRRDSLVAAAGWCAPSETLYEVCFQGTTDGLIDVPEVQARRGGIRYNQGITFATIYGDGAANFFNLTEAEVASGTTKTCIEITCPTFTDVRLGVTGICLTGNILTARAYPEAVETFTRAALTALAHKINFEVIADMVAGSDAVALGAVEPWVSDGSVVSQVLSAVDMAVMDIKYRMRLAQSATLEVVMPFWILTQMRADWIRRNGVNDLTLANAEIMAAFAARGARVQFVYDWQDAFSGVATGPGAAAAVTSFPTSLVFMVYPAGTWVKAVQNVITINSMYDSTKLATNQYTHLFTEDGWAMAKMCGISRVYTVGICPTGSTGVQREVSCVA